MTAVEGSCVNSCSVAVWNCSTYCCSAGVVQQYVSSKLFVCGRGVSQTRT